MVAPNTGELADALEAGRIDVSFMPVDEERKKRIDFGPVYFLVESTYMVNRGLGIKTVDEVDRTGIRVVGIANTTTIPRGRGTLKNTTVMAAPSIGDAMAMMTGGKADALALSRDSLHRLSRSFPARAWSRAASVHRRRLAVRRRRRRRWLVDGVPGDGEAVGPRCGARLTAPGCRIWTSRRNDGAVGRAVYFAARLPCCLRHSLNSLETAAAAARVARCSQPSARRRKSRAMRRRVAGAEVDIGELMAHARSIDG
jgi:hypothetical protein